MDGIIAALISGGFALVGVIITNMTSMNKIRQELKTQQAVMVGDTHFDVLGAAAHGIPTIGVSWGYGAVSAMEDAGAIAIAHTMDELYDLLNN